MRLSCSEACWNARLSGEWIASLDVYASTNLEDREDGDTYSGSLCILGFAPQLTLPGSLITLAAP